MRKKFTRTIIAGVLACALTLSAVPAEVIAAESLVEEAVDIAVSDADSSDDPVSVSEAESVPGEEILSGGDTQAGAEETGETPAEDVYEEAMPGEYDQGDTAYTEDISGAGESFDEEESQEEEVTPIEQFTEDCDNISGGIIPVVWNSTDEAETLSSLESFTEEIVGASTLPESYETSAKSGVRSQSYQRCWVHSLTTSSEMSMIAAGLADTLDYSERQIIYGYFNQTGGDKGLPYMASSWKEAPGNYLMATAAAANHIGLASEDSFASDDSMTVSDLDNNISHIEKAIFLGSWPTDESEWKGSVWKALNTSVKAAVMEYGAVAVTYYSSYITPSKCYYTTWTSGQKKTSADHSVTVIGWDDTKVVRSDVESGAFLVQNSWSSTSQYTINGYNWISYYDASLGTATVYVPEHEAIGTLRDEDVFSYTGTGYAGQVLSGINSAANIFTAEHDELVDCVGFYADAANHYSVQVVTNLTDYSDPASGNIAASVSGTTEGAGFFKVRLSKNIKVSAGDKFAVVLSMYNHTDMKHRALFEGPTSKLRTTTCETGQSFILSNGQYLDCGNSSVTVGGESLKSNYGNVCIYAYGNPTPDGPFPDVPYDHAYASAITWAVNKGITKGFPDTGLFGLNLTCTRGQIMMFLWRFAGKPQPKYTSKSPFSDVPTTHAYYRAILWGSQEGITKGYSDGTFGIDRYCTRGQIMMFLWRYKGCPKPSTTKNPFKDYVTSAYLKAVIWSYEKGVAKGFSDGTYRDTKSCTRGEAVKFLYNLYLKT